MSKTITTKRLGELLQHWHDSQSDPIYAVGSLLYAVKPVDEGQIKKARDRIRSLLKSAEHGSHGWGQQEVEELKTISDGLSGLLRVYNFGEMPTLDDFRKHLSHDLDPQGRRYIGSRKPILQFDLKGNLGQQALSATYKADENRAAAGKGRTDISATQKGDTVSIAANNIESLYYWIAALTQSGSDASKLAKTIMEDLGYSWVGKANPSRNPTETFSIGDRVQLHPATDRWMMGDRYGVVVKTTKGRRPGPRSSGSQPKVQVKLDKSGKTIWFSDHNVQHVYGNPSNERDLAVANTILQQLGGSTRRLGIMIGAHSFIAIPNGVAFLFKARARNGSNALRINLDPSDTYTVEFLSIRGKTRKAKGTFYNIYADQLKSLFESETGLYLSI